MKVTNLVQYIILLLLALSGVQGRAQTETIKVWGDDLSVTADQKTVSQLVIHESDITDYAAFNMELVVPEGITVACLEQNGQPVNDIHLNVHRDPGSFSLLCNQPEETSVKVIGYSLSLGALKSAKTDGTQVDELFTLGLLADPAMVNGDYEIRLTDCKFVTAEGQTVVPSHLEPVTLTVTGGVDNRQTVNCTIGESGWTTLILPFDAALPEGMEAYVCTEIRGDALQTEKQTAIPALVPLLIRGNPGDYLFKGWIDVDVNRVYTQGLLSGVLKEKQIEEGYILQKQEELPAFYPLQEGKPYLVPAYQCWLTSDVDLSYIYVDGTPTGLDEVILNETDGKVYDLKGKKVDKITSPDVYIKDHQKKLLK